MTYEGDYDFKKSEDGYDIELAFCKVLARGDFEELRRYAEEELGLDLEEKRVEIDAVDDMIEEANIPYIEICGSNYSYWMVIDVAGRVDDKEYLQPTGKNDWDISKLTDQAKEDTIELDVLYEQTGKPLLIKGDPSYIVAPLILEDSS